MNRQRLAAVSVSNESVRQVLFVMLALLVTLLAGQQYQRWSQAQQHELLLEPQARPVAASQFIQASAKSSDQAALYQVERSAEVAQVPNQPRWVF